MTVFPKALAVRVVRVVWAVVLPIFSVPLELFVKPPLPAKVVETVSVPVLVSVIPVTAKLGMAIAVVPPMDWELVLKVCTPVPAVKVPPLLVSPALKVAG